MRVVLFTLMSVVCTVAFSATVYRWVDENGVTHFSDQPHENAQKVQVAAPQTYKPAPLPRSTGSQSSPPNASNTYQCQVVAPASGQEFANTYAVNTTVDVDPLPHDGDRAFLLLDGARVPNFPVNGGPYKIDNIERGQHTLQAVVQDSNGKLLCQSANVSFTVFQPSVLNPANPNHKH
jgi:hypothetical protein